MLNSSMRFDERSRILKWMRAVGVEEAATVGAPFLDDLLRSNWSLRDRLSRNDVHYRLTVCVDDWFAVWTDALYMLWFDQSDCVIGLQSSVRHPETQVTELQQYKMAAAPRDWRVPYQPRNCRWSASGAVQCRE